VGDRYAGQFPAEQFAKHGILYEPSERPKTALYVDLLPALNSGLIDLLDNERLVNQLCAMERRVTRGGKDLIDHPPHGRDDVANACAGALTLCLLGSNYGLMEWVSRPQGDPAAVDAASAEWRRKQLVQHVMTGGGVRPW
jgi:hypothetical protein